MAKTTGKVPREAQLEFVGREGEFSELQSVLKEVREGAGRTVLVSGEAGVGKTSFVKKFAEEERHIKFLYSNCSHYDQPRPYQPFTEIADELERAEETEKDGLPGLDIIESALQPIEEIRDVNPDVAKDNIYGTFLDVFRRSTSSDSPLFIFIDDLHWADTSSLYLFHYLARNLKGMPVLLCGTYRPEDMVEESPLSEVVTRLKHEKLVEFLELERLTRDDIDTVVSGLTDRGDEIYRITEGNPLFVSKILETLEETGDHEEVSLPESVKDIVMHRVGDLSANAKRVLKIAAVIGEEFRGRLLEEMIGDMDMFLDGIDELIERRILREKRGLEKEVYEFDHRLIQQAVYHDLTKHSRQVRHREIGKKLEGFLKEDEDVVYDLSRHFYLGKTPDKSLEYSLKAAERAEDMYAHEEALKFYGYALESIDEVGPGRKDEIGVEKNDILQDLGDICNMTGKYDRSMDHYKGALELADEDQKKAELYGNMAEVLIDEGGYEESLKYCEKGLSLIDEENIKRVRLLNKKGWAFIRQGDYDEAIQVFSKELDLAESLDDREERAQALHDLGTVRLRKGDHDKAEDLLKRAIEIGQKVEDSEGPSDSFNNIGVLKRYNGELDEALEYQEKSLEISRKIGNKSGVASSLNNMGLIYSDKGNLDKALEHYKKSHDIYEEIGNRSGITISYNNIGLNHSKKGELDEALEYYERSLEIREEIGDKSGISMSFSNIGDIYRIKGELDKALEYHKRSLDIAEAIGEKEGMVRTLTELASTQLKREEIEEARSNAQKALQIATDMGFELGESRCQKVLGMVSREQKNWAKSEERFEKSIEFLEDGQDEEELAETRYEYGSMLAEKGQEERAREHLEKALSMFEGMGMQLWIQRTEEALSSLSK